MLVTVHCTFYTKDGTAKPNDVIDLPKGEAAELIELQLASAAPAGSKPTFGGSAAGKAGGVEQ